MAIRLDRNDVADCPLCSGHSRAAELMRGRVIWVQITCENCGLTFKGEDVYAAEILASASAVYSALEKWNTRAAPVEQLVSVDELAEASTTRDERQKRVADWCAAAFGVEHQASVQQRGLRMLEEAIEAYQALGGKQEQAHRLIDYVFAKEPGDLFQELGGLGLTVLALAAAAGMSADEAERTEIARVLSKPLEWFHARNEIKNEAGFDATSKKAEQKLQTATHRHIKSGRSYILLGIAKMQTEFWLDGLNEDADFGDVDMREVAVYRSLDDGSLWVLPREEFEDGRFEALPAPTSAGA